MESKSHGGVKPAKKTIGQVVDEYGHLLERLAPLKAIEKRAKELAALIQNHCEKFDAASANVLEGRSHDAMVGQKAHQRRITDMPAVFQIIGKTEFLEHCKMNLSDLDDLVPLTKRAHVVTEERTGPRTITMFPKSSPAVAKRAA